MFKIKIPIILTKNYINKTPILSNNLALKLIISFALLVVILILFSEKSLIIKSHAGFLKVQSDHLKFSNLVRIYLDNYFNQKLLNEREIFNLAEQDSNLALKYTTEWHRNDWHSRSKEWSDVNVRTCLVKPPPIQNIHMNNIYWQSVVNTDHLNLYTYNAYYDNRQTKNKIRIIGVSDHFNNLVNTTLWCLLYFEGKKKSVLTEVTQINELAYDFGNFYKRKGYYLPVLITCDLSDDLGDLVPKAVAIKTNIKCSENLNNLLRVIYNKPDYNRVEMFGVCVRALYYRSYDFSLRLLEWLEMIRILGANKVILYSFTVHPNMEKVIYYYKTKNFIDWRHSTHSGKQLNNKFLDEIYIKRMGDFLLPQETLELNDCLYRNLYKFEYLVILDIDELIVPVKAYSWHDLIPQIHTRFYNDLESEKFTGNKYLYTMRHLYRDNFTNNAPKAFHLTKNIKVIWNHSALKCLHNDTKEDCPLHWVNKDFGYLVHYRPGVDKPINCGLEDMRGCATYDPILVKYNKVLEANVKIALNDIFG